MKGVRGSVAGAARQEERRAEGAQARVFESVPHTRAAVLTITTTSSQDQAPSEWNTAFCVSMSSIHNAGARTGRERGILDLELEPKGRELVMDSEQEPGKRPT